MDGWMIDGCMNGCMKDGCMDEKIGGEMNEWIEVNVNEKGEKKGYMDDHWRNEARNRTRKELMDDTFHHNTKHG